MTFLRRAEGDEWPDLSDAGLTATADRMAGSILDGKAALPDVPPTNFPPRSRRCSHGIMKRRLDAEAPTHFSAPPALGADRLRDRGGAELSIRVQELFGLDRHPSIANGKVPLVVELLSPAHRPVQVTRDLPGFWRGSYAAVKTEMRGRYPRHPWPDDPLPRPPPAAPSRAAPDR